MEYLTTREVAKYLRLNEKKIYALVAERAIPSVKISGKWLFPKKILKQWLQGETLMPQKGQMAALLEQMIVVQGSDDWLFSQVINQIQPKSANSIVTASVGSLGGLLTLDKGTAHVAGFHLDFKKAGGGLKKKDWYILSLMEREQGYIFRPEQVPKIFDFSDILRCQLRFAYRQVNSGTYQATLAQLKAGNIDWSALSLVGPFSSHLEVGWAILNHQAEVGLGLRIVAEYLGLQFQPLFQETYRLAIPATFFANPRIKVFIDHLLEGLRQFSKRGVPGYEFRSLGKLESLGEMLK